MTLLKNDGILPLKGTGRIGLFGPAADELNLGDYSGGYCSWNGEGAITPYEGLKAALSCGWARMPTSASPSAG